VSFDPDAWWECEEYLFGFDLFNAGYYWEAHEAWESCWHAVGRKGPAADLLKGLIRLAACGVKAREGRRDGVASHSAAAARLFRSVMDGEEGAHVIGLDARELLRLSEEAGHAESVEPGPTPRRVFAFELGPERPATPRGGR
jgi:hypothetical protein